MILMTFLRVPWWTMVEHMWRVTGLCSEETWFSQRTEPRRLWLSVGPANKLHLYNLINSGFFLYVKELIDLLIRQLLPGSDLAANLVSQVCSQTGREISGHFCVRCPTESVATGFTYCTGMCISRICGSPLSSLSFSKVKKHSHIL